MQIRYDAKVNPRGRKHVLNFKHISIAGQTKKTSSFGFFIRCNVRCSYTRTFFVSNNDMKTWILRSISLFEWSIISLKYLNDCVRRD